MTAWASIAALHLAMFAAVPASAAPGDEKDKDKVKGAAEKARDDADEAPPRVDGTVKLDLQISGLGSEGAKVTIRPAHPGCRFKTIEKTIAKGPNSGSVRLAPITLSASTTSADRDCSFKITVTEPGRPPKTFRRGLQLSAADSDSGEPARPQSVKCSVTLAEAAPRDDAKTAKTDTSVKTRR